MSTCLYFAFGSNMLRERLCVADRCLTARSLGAGTAADHRVTMWKRGRRDGSGKATLVAAEGHVAHGVLYEISPEELALLDKSEGAGIGYYREEALRVELPGRSVVAHTYIAPPDHVDESLLPFDWYSALCLAGAMQHALPGHHLDWLRSHPTRPDADTARKSRQRALGILRSAGFGPLADRCEDRVPTMGISTPRR